MLPELEGLSLGPAATDHDMPVSPAVHRNSFFLPTRCLLTLFLFSGLVANGWIQFRYHAVYCHCR